MYGILNSKSRPGADCKSDHNPVVAKVKIKHKCPHKKMMSNFKWDLERIRQSQTKSQFTTMFKEEMYQKTCTNTNDGDSNPNTM